MKLEMCVYVLHQGPGALTLCNINHSLLEINMFVCLYFAINAQSLERTNYHERQTRET